MYKKIKNKLRKKKSVTEVQVILEVIEDNALSSEADSMYGHLNKEKLSSFSGEEVRFLKAWGKLNYFVN